MPTAIVPPDPMAIVPPDPMVIAADFRVHVDNLRKLAALHPDDAFYVQAAEQVAMIVAGLEARATPTKPPEAQP